jgi:hypothetical protein
MKKHQERNLHEATAQEKSYYKKIVAILNVNSAKENVYAHYILFIFL